MASYDTNDWMEIVHQDQIDVLLAMPATEQVVLMRPGYTPLLEDEVAFRLRSEDHAGKGFFIITSGPSGMSAWLAKTHDSMKRYEILRRHGFRNGDRLVGIFTTDQAAVTYATTLNERRRSSAA